MAIGSKCRCTTRGHREPAPRLFRQALSGSAIGNGHAEVNPVIQYAALPPLWVFVGGQCGAVRHPTRLPAAGEREGQLALRGCPQPFSGRDIPGAAVAACGNNPDPMHRPDERSGAANGPKSRAGTQGEVLQARIPRYGSNTPRHRNILPLDYHPGLPATWSQRGVRGQRTISFHAPVIREDKMVAAPTFALSPPSPPSLRLSSL